MKEAYMREGYDHTDDPLIMNVARICAECAYEYGGGPCGACKYNTALYMNGNVNRAALLRINAERQLSEYRMPDVTPRHHSGAGWSAVIMIGIVVAAFFGIRQYGVNSSSKTTARSAVPRTAPIEKAKSNIAPVIDSVQRSLGAVKRNIRDLNRDGQINCQDYAAQFVREYPRAQIVYNPKIGPTGHVFNRVNTSDGWLYIEPQNKGGVWLMREAWPQWENVRHLNQEMTARFRR